MLRLIDRLLGWRWLTFAILWMGGSAVLLAMVLIGFLGASWLMVAASLLVGLALLVGFTVWGVRYVRSWEAD